MCTGALANRPGFPPDGAKADVLGPPPVLVRPDGGTGAGTMTGFAWCSVLLSIKPGGTRTAGSGPLRQINNGEHQCHCDQNSNHDLFPCSHKFSRNDEPDWPGLSRSAKATGVPYSDMPGNWRSCSPVRHFFSFVVQIKTRTNLGFVHGVVCTLSNIKDEKRLGDPKARHAKGTVIQLSAVQGRDESHDVVCRRKVSTLLDDAGGIGSNQSPQPGAGQACRSPVRLRARMNRVMPRKPLLRSNRRSL